MVIYRFALLFIAICLVQGQMLFPQDSESREIKDLSGIWQFQRDDNSTGIEDAWYKGLPGPLIQMPVPSSYNDITQDASLRDFIGWVWYQRRFFVSSPWSSRRIVLRVESAHYYSAVWLNGVQIITHVGGHLPFESEDISDMLNYDSENLLVVAVNNTLTDCTLPPGIITIQDGSNPMYPKGYTTQQTFFDFFNYAGIHRPVKLYSTPKVFIDDITINYDISDTTGYVDFNITVSPLSESDQIQVKLLDANQNIVATSTNFIDTLKVANANFWAPGSPYLYTMQITSTGKGGEVDVYRLGSIGIRTVELKNNKLYLNNKPIYLHGVDKHEDADIRGKGLDYPTLVKDFNLLKWLNVNAIRTSHYPYAEEFYMEADRNGILIIDECPAVGLAQAQFFNSRTLEHHRNVMFEMIRRDKNHPSIIMWNVANEPSSDLPVAYDYFANISAYTREIDPTKRLVTLVNDVDFNGQTCAEFFDVVCVNRYYSWYTDSGHLELINRQLSYDLDGWYNKYKKPIIVSEYGADTLNLHDDPPVMFTEEYQVDFMQQYQNVFSNKSQQYLIGELVWNFADFRTGQSVTRVASKNSKGVFSRQRQPKRAAFELKKRYQSLN